MSTVELNVIILAAGKGSRMVSKIPKPLHKIGGSSFFERIFRVVKKLKPTRIYVIYNPKEISFYNHYKHLDLIWIEQKKQLGTGDAVKQVLPKLTENSKNLIICVDTPLITTKTLKNFISAVPCEEIGCITAILKNPNGYGRVIRDSKGIFMGISEDKDLDKDARKFLTEVNSGIYIIPFHHLVSLLSQLSQNNSKKEYYLSEIFSLAREREVKISTFKSNVDEIRGVNNSQQLNYLERLYQRLNTKRLLKKGLRIMDIERFDLRGDIEFGVDVTIDVGVILEGKIVLGDGSYVGPYSHLKDVTCGKNVRIESHTVISDATIGDNSTIGPFAHMRPKSKIGSEVRIGNFVEIKKSQISNNCKICHHAYIGDTTMGQEVNIGGGVIICNYDGLEKHNTEISHRCFIGANSSLVAPIKVGDGTIIAAGSTIIKDVKPNQLVIARSEQVTREKKLK